ncbi:MAG TPA: nitrile hydratase accessory protein [Solirubrobacteraceae bacterium]
MIDDPVFAEPWEAEAFALVLQLHERGVFTWPEWSSALAEEIRRAPGETYYRQWLAALERLVAEKGLTDPATLARYRAAWERAAERTPHGTPIELAAQDFG